MDWIAIAIAACLTIVAAIHFLWAFGSTWPAQDEPTLARMVVGTLGITQMPPKWLTALAAICILGAGIIPLMWRGLVPYPHIVPQTMLWLAMWSLTLIFVVRGAASYLPLMGNMEQSFARLNRLFFAPLILAVGAGLMILTIEPLT